MCDYFILRDYHEVPKMQYFYSQKMKQTKQKGQEKIKK